MRCTCREVCPSTVFALRDFLSAGFQVSMEQLTYDQFQDMLTELFLIGEGGVTRERIMVLFVFCSDVAICFLVRKAMDLFQQLIAWSMRYITERVCAWVTDHGGWVRQTCICVINSCVVLDLG